MGLIFSNINILDNEITGIIGDTNHIFKKILIDKIEVEGEENLNNQIISYINKRNFLTKTISDEFFLIKKNLKDKDNYIEKVLSALEMVGLSDEYLEKDIYTLSKSEKVLLEIALALIINPDIVIFDNVFNNLDRKNKLIIKKIIMGLKRKYNKTVIIIDDINILYEICSNFIILKNNKVLLNGDREDIINSDVFNNNEIEIPFLIEFANLAKNYNKNIKYYQDINDLLKGVYKNAR